MNYCPICGGDCENGDAGHVLVDQVNHPKHYTFGKYEVIDVLEDWQLNFHLGNAVKYIARAGKKGDALEDLKKALWYVEREIKRREQCG